MHLYIRDAFSEIIEGVVLAVGRNRLRIAVRKWHDTIEIVYRNGQWLTEDGRELRLESLVTDGRCNGDFFDEFFVRFQVAT
jgi:hypothetical protein